METLPLEVLDLLHFFSPLTNCSSQPLPFHRLALFGASAPSTPLHLALSYAQGRRAAAARQTATGSDDTLPLEKHVLLLCTSRNKLFEGLVLENEEYLAVHGGDPSVARSLKENVEMRFVDTMVKWTFFCSAVSTKGYRYTSASEGRVLNLKKPPDLVIVSELSFFLDENRNQGAGIETYASLVASTLAAFPSSTRFVFFDDPPEQHLTLPLLPLQHQSKLRQMQADKRGNTTSPERANTGPQPRLVELQGMMEYFCDGVGDISPEGGSEDILWYRMRIKKTAAHTPVQCDVIQPWEDLDKRYSVHRGEDEAGHSGRERWTVRFT